MPTYQSSYPTQGSRGYTFLGKEYFLNIDIKFFEDNII